MTKKTFAIYIALLHLVLVALLATTDAVPKVRAYLGRGSPAPSDIEVAHRRFVERRDPIVPIGASIFLGDSITHGLVESRVAANSVNFGIPGQRSSHLIDALPSYTSMSAASRIYLMIGINDIANKEEQALQARYQSLAEMLPADVPLTWSGLMPMAGFATQVMSANELIRETCSTMPQCVFIDTFSPLANEQGDPAEGSMLDGIHPSKSGYETWISLLLDDKGE